MTNDEFRMGARGAAALRRLPFVIRHSSFLVLWLLFATSLHALPTRQTSDDIPQLAPPLPEIPPTLWEQFGWLAWFALPFVLMATAIIAAIWLRPRKPPVLLASAAQAHAALTALQCHSEDGATLSQISQTLRRYLITTFWLHPGETTTAEFCATLATNARAGSELSGAINEFLRRCDERKFSPGQAAPPLDAARRALKLVEQTEARREQLQTKVQPAASE